MYEQFNLTKKLKRQLGSAISILLSVAMLVTALPAELLRAGNVEAAEAPDQTEGVVQPGSAGDQTWNFKSETTDLVHAEGSTGTYKGLQIDASASGAKFQMRSGDWAIFNKGAIIKVPVDGPCEITVDNYDTNYSVNGEAAAEKNQTFSYVGKAGYVPVAATGASYIGSISTKHIETDPDDTHSGQEKDGVAAGLTDFTVLQNLSQGDVPKITGITFNDVVYWNNHGLHTRAENATMVLKLSKKANVTVTMCHWGYGNMTASSGKAESEPCEESDGDSQRWIVTGAEAGDLTLTFASGLYIHSVEVEYQEAVVAEGLTDFTKITGLEQQGTAVPEITGFKFNNIVYWNDHGLATKAADATMVLKLSKKANVTVTLCQHGKGDMTASSGKVESEACKETADGDSLRWIVTGAEAGDLTLTFASGLYIHSVEVEYPEEDVSQVQLGLTDFTALKDVSQGAVPKIPGYKFNNIVYWNDHGLQTKAADATMVLNLSNEANVTVTLCQHGKGTMTASSGKAESEACTETADGDSRKWIVTGAEAGELTLTFNPDSGVNNVYIHSVEVEYLVDYIEEKTYLFGNMPEETAKAIKGLTFDGQFKDFANKHGFCAADGSSSLWLELSGQATIVVTTCVYGNGNLKSSNGEVITGTVKEESGTGKEYMIKGATGRTKLTLGAGAYVHSMSVMYDYVGERPALDSGTPDVWDFGAMTVTGANNLLTADVINGFYSDVTAGSEKISLPAFVSRDSNGVPALKFVSDKTGNRLRTTNTNLTRYDDASLTDKDGNTYEGHLYSNYASSEATRLDIYLYEGDTLRCMLGSNEKPATYNLYALDGEVCGTFEYTAQNGVEEAVFHAAEDGWYKLICMNEKLVCARITREHAPEVTVSGDIDVTDAGDIPAEYGIVFTNQATGQVTEMTRTNNTYSGILYGGYTYEVSLKGADGYVVKGGRTLELGKDAQATHNLKLEKVQQRVITGNITGLPEAQLAKVELSFTVPKEYVFKPVLNLDRSNGAFTLNVEDGVKYAVSAEGVNDYSLQTTEISATADTAMDIRFEKKPVYKVTLKITGVADSTNAVATFTNIDEEGYVYTFPVADNMELRDGRYSVVVTGLDNYPVVQGLTANVNVKGEPTSTTVPFHEISSWDFGVLNEATGDKTPFPTIGEQTYYAGLQLSGSIMKNKTYLLIKPDSVVVIPNLKKNDKVTVKYCYEAAFKLGDISVDEKSGSTDQIDSVEYTVAEDGNVSIEGKTGTAAGQAYLCGIEVLRASDKIPYAATLSVGPDKTYKTIGAALADVKKMDKTADQKVTIMIDPGNYEEMLVVDTPNVTLKNASKTPSIELKNKGVDIDENAVRVTWYYGHGYTYYSMGSDYKYNADTLAVNKSNGFASCENPGAGSGTYWNSTVVINADNFNAEGIIFENSFNQYVSAKSLEDVIVAQSGAKEGTAKRAEMTTLGDTKVQEKDYVERAAALAITNNIKQVYFKNCKFVSRQDTLYGGVNSTAGFESCSIYGGTDYIFGGMTAVFKQCDLVFNTNDQTEKGLKDDVGYITAPQQSAGRGYLMYECTVTSTTPGVDTASEHTSKPGYFGRPWQGKTGEAVFYKTTIEQADPFWNAGKSLICDAGWDSSLGGESELCGEYGTIEKSGVDNSANRVSWAKVFTEEKLADGTPISIESYLGEWDAFGSGNVEPGQYTITIDRQDGTTPVVKIIDAGTELTQTDLPSTLNREGYIFKGWVDEEGAAITVPYTPTKSMTIRATWQKDDIGTGDGTDDGSDLVVTLADPDKEYVYTGSAIKPGIIVKNNGKRLTEGVDYTVKYSNNTKAEDKSAKKAPRITISGKGNLAGSAFATFTIKQKSIADQDVVKGSIVVVKGSKAAPVMIYNGMKLGTKDYEFAVKDDAKKKFTEDGKIKINGKGNYTGSIELDVKVVEKKDLKKFIVEVGKEVLTYNPLDNKPQAPTITVKDKETKQSLKENEDYIILYNGDQKSAGTQKFTVVGLGWYSGTVAKTYKIKPLAVTEINDFKIEGVEASYPFVSSGVTVGNKLKVSYKGMPLQAGKDYKVTYSNNKKVSGKSDAKYKIAFLGNYKGSKSTGGTFKITPAPLSNKTVDICISADKIYKKPGQYKSAPYVTVDGVLLKSSNYKVEYYLDKEMKKPMNNQNKVTLAEGADSVTVYVKIIGKGNYAPADNNTFASTEFKVWSASGKKDLSKARVTFYDKKLYDKDGKLTDAKKVTKLEYTGRKVKPGDVVVEIKDGKKWQVVPSDQYDLTYVNNVNKGKATVVINAKGKDYVGGKTASYSIVVKKLQADLVNNLFKMFTN